MTIFLQIIVLNIEGTPFTGTGKIQETSRAQIATGLPVGQEGESIKKMANELSKLCVNGELITQSLQKIVQYVQAEIDKLYESKSFANAVETTIELNNLKKEAESQKKPYSIISNGLSSGNPNLSMERIQKQTQIETFINKMLEEFHLYKPKGKDAVTDAQQILLANQWIDNMANLTSEKWLQLLLNVPKELLDGMLSIVQQHQAFILRQQDVSSKPTSAAFATAVESQKPAIPSKRKNNIQQTQVKRYLFS